jgi:DNA (cytosine-5)-methyltransferase 1
MKHLELFSGVGGFRKAMEYVSKDLHVPFVTIGFSEIDKNATKTYMANFDTQGETVLGDIVTFINDRKRFNSLPKIDILTGGFPCQTFSMMGKQAGFAEDRGQMFFRIMDIVKKKKPNYLILENVRNLVNHDKGNTFKVILYYLEKAGYNVQHDIFNTEDFGLPQKRQRTIIVARKKTYGNFNFSAELVKESFSSIDRSKCSLDFYGSVLDILDAKVDKKYYLSEKVKPTILSDGTGGFKSKSDIDLIIARPLTASMHKMHRACQDNYYSDEFILSHGKIRPSERMSKEELAGIPIRKLTPKEAFMLQGFPNDFAEKASLARVSNGAMYKEAGNAVSVNTIYAILYYLIQNNILR